jgi:ferredoxin-NADP reductase
MSFVIEKIDSFLNTITMYRLVLYGLLFLVIQAALLSAVGILPFNPVFMIFSLLILFVSCYLTNQVWGKLLQVSINVESATITALILFFLFDPFSNIKGIPVLILAGVISMSSKYLLAIQKKHIFNPAGIAAVILGLTSFGGATWWIGSSVMIPTTAVIGLLIVRKIRRFHLLFSFMAPAIFMILLMGVLAHLKLLDILTQIVTSWPILFFGTIMLTEPLTTPLTMRLRMGYGVLVGILFGAQFHVGPVYSTPEVALVLGNIFSYLVTPKIKQSLRLIRKNKLSPDLYEFIFETEKRLPFTAGQYLEWTLGHAQPDSRGNRRYFTIASSPTESDIRLSIKVFPDSSSYKKKLLMMNAGEKIMVDQLSGDFVLPKDQSQKVVFIAGGIGITPFRSMIQYVIDKKEQRNIVLFFANKNADDIIYQDTFLRAQSAFGMKTVYTLSSDGKIPKNWNRHVGRIDSELIKKEVPDFADRMYYLSGPHAMVTAYADILSSMGIKKEKIMIDFFPGFV